VFYIAVYFVLQKNGLIGSIRCDVGTCTWVDISDRSSKEGYD
jgi:hypothetical protein